MEERTNLLRLVTTRDEAVDDAALGFKAAVICRSSGGVEWCGCKPLSINDGQLETVK